MLIAFPQFQSRNRDAFHFRKLIAGGTDFGSFVVSISQSRCFSFQGIRSLGARYHVAQNVSISQSRCFSFQGNCNPHRRCFGRQFQSRNRDAFHFRGRMIGHLDAYQDKFQSRNRDAFHFRNRRRSCIAICYSKCFNLAIEMLFISGLKALRNNALFSLFQSRNRDAFHFRWVSQRGDSCGVGLVSISQSRCFSFQACACLLLGIRGRVSISQSRCFSFQENT